MKQALIFPLLLCACGGDFYAYDDFGFSDGDWVLESEVALPIMSLVKAEVNGEAPFICGKDSGFGGAARWRFRAPGRYQGNASRFFKRRLTWDAMTDYSQTGGRLYDASEISISGRGISLFARVADTPRNSKEWAQFFVYLDARTPWRKDATDFPLATDAEIEAVLSSLTGVKLPGEWRDGQETTCIDNIYFGTP